MPRKQGGAILIFCLVFLLVLTMMSVSSMESTVLEERMAGNMQDYSVAFQAAEAALQAGEDWLESQVFWPAVSSDGSTPVWQQDAMDPTANNSVSWWSEVVRDDSDWWGANALTADGFTDLAAAPGYIIEEYATVSTGESIAIGNGAQTRTRVFHRITARGTGENESTVVQVQSTFVKPYE